MCFFWTSYITTVILLYKSLNKSDSFMYTLYNIGDYISIVEDLVSIESETMVPL